MLAHACAVLLSRLVKQPLRQRPVGALLLLLLVLTILLLLVVLLALLLALSELLLLLALVVVPCLGCASCVGCQVTIIAQSAQYRLAIRQAAVAAMHMISCNAPCDSQTEQLAQRISDMHIQYRC
jgi:hypothetical protein